MDFFKIILYLIPFLVTTAIPALFLPKIVSMFFSKNLKSENFNFLPFTLSLIILSIGGILFWEFGLFNRVYYEWDRFYFAYNFFFYNRPILDSLINWLAPGWTFWYLYLIWLVTTFGIYLVTLLVCFRFSQKYKDSYLYRKIVLISISPFILLTLIASVFNFLRTNNEIASNPKSLNPFFSFVNEERCVRKWEEGCVKLLGSRSTQTSSIRTLGEAIDSLQLKKISSDNIVEGVVNTDELKCVYDRQDQTYKDVQMKSSIYRGISFVCWFVKPFPQALKLRTKDR